MLNRDRAKPSNAEIQGESPIPTFLAPPIPSLGRTITPTPTAVVMKKKNNQHSSTNGTFFAASCQSEASEPTEVNVPQMQTHTTTVTNVDIRNITGVCGTVLNNRTLSSTPPVPTAEAHMIDYESSCCHPMSICPPSSMQAFWGVSPSPLAMMVPPVENTMIDTEVVTPSQAYAALSQCASHVVTLDNLHPTIDSYQLIDTFEQFGSIGYGHRTSIMLYTTTVFPSLSPLCYCTFALN